MDDFFSELDATLNKKWIEIAQSNPFFQLILNGEIDRRLYALYLIETFHYAAHNTKNQAAVISNIKLSTPDNVRYMKFCLHHAFEECGHELMAYHDLKSIGFNISLENFPEVIKGTTDLIKYVYQISENGNPLQRLGYSYWAESSYKYFTNVIKTLSEKLNLKNGNLTFLVAHSDIDVDHFEEIKEIMRSQIKTQADKDAIKAVMIESLDRTAIMLESICNKYISIQSEKYEDFLSGHYDL